MVISQIVEFLKDAVKTAETHKVLDSVIYSEATFGAIYPNLPDDIKGRFNRNASDSRLDYKKRIQGLATFMESERVGAGEGLHNSEESSIKERKSYDNKAHFADGDDFDNNSGCKYCNGKSCKQAWDALGCLEIYKLQE